ncbi:galactose-3-O-sulfotransferase 2-like [Littorina saxatilis]|uniref:Uncharacterized protein n=1 Tax=Littorina saxatilis TaxID=31220 RepID=A0AAN9AXD7_9CAEN
MAELVRNGGSRRFNLMTTKLAFLMLIVCSVGVWMVITDHLTRSTAYTIPENSVNIRNLLGWDSFNTLATVEHAGEPGPRKHVFFLNVHKTGGTNVKYVLLHFARRYNLTVLLPKAGPHFSEHSKNYWHNVDPRARGRRNDILCDYSVFNETFVSALMPKDTLYVGIVRYPFEQFLAAFLQYESQIPQDYLTSIPGPYRIATYLSDPKKWEHPDPSQSFTNNRMSFDFGLDVAQWSDKGAIKRHLDYLDVKFDLVMVTEKLDESLILLRRLAGWSLQDIIYVKWLSPFGQEQTYLFNETQRHRHKQFQYPDYALYRRFEAVLYQKISQQAGYGFHEELNKFRSTVETVRVFCEQKAKKTLQIKASVWNTAFTVTRKDCLFMTGALPFVNTTTLELN